MPTSHHARAMILAVLLGSVAQVCASQDGEPAPDRRAELLNMVRQDCGSCHGLTMKGGLGPPLLPETLADKNIDQMQFVVLNGRPGTAMPPWRPFVSESEARWIVEALRKGLPDER